MPLIPAGTHLTRRGRMAFLVAGAVAVALVAWGVVALASSGPALVPRSESTGTATSSPSPTSTVHGPSACAFGDIPAANASYGRWNETLLDTTFALGPQYEPPDLVPISEAGFDSPLLIRGLVVRDLAGLREAAARAGNPVDVEAAYRSYADQGGLFRERVRELGHRRALRRTARPGHSEHQLGTAVDFKTAGAADVHQGWERTPAGSWTAANAWRYGFVLSYPKDERNHTCYSYEPWHVRYVGRALASKVQASGLTLREYLWYRFVLHVPVPTG